MVQSYHFFIKFVHTFTELLFWGMKKLQKIWGGMTTNERLMLGLVVLFLVGIVLRWDFISEQVVGSVRNLFSI